MHARRGSRVALGALVVAVLLSSCATGGDPNTTTRQNLTVMLADDWASAPAVVDAITDFERANDVQVMVRPTKFAQLEEFMIADRTGPRDVDVSQWHAFAAGALGYAQPVTERFETTYGDDVFVPSAIEDVTWDREVYGVPLDVNAVVMIVNTDLLASLGHDLDDLRTFDGLQEVARSAGERDVALTHLAASAWSMYAWLRANGGDWFASEPIEAPVLAFDDPVVGSTFEFLAGLTEDGLAIPADSIDTDADAYPLFVEERTLLLATGTWDVARLVDDEPGFSWEVVPMPTGPSGDGPGTVLGGSSLYVTEQAGDAALAWRFATHMVEPEYALRYAREDGRLPGRADVLDDPIFEDRRYDVAVEQLPNASAMRLIAFPRILDRATSSIHAVLHNEVAPGEAFARLQEEATRMADGDEGQGDE